MADVKPLKLVDTGGGQGALHEFAAGDKMPAGILPAAVESLATGDAEAVRAALELGTFATANYDAAPFVNLMPDSGRFAGRMNPLSLAASGAFTESPFFSNVNGSAQVSAGKFINNNSTNGGAAGALTTDVQDLLAAMGRTGGRALNGPEFYVNSITAGSGTAVSSVGTDSTARYLLSTNGSRVLFVSAGAATFTGWVRAKSGSAHISAPYYKNGVLVPAGTPIGSSFVHVRIHSATTIGYDNAFPRLCAVPGSVIQLACCAFYSGVVDAGIHTAPLPTVNELSA